MFVLTGASEQRPICNFGGAVRIRVENETKEDYEAIIVERRQDVVTLVMSNQPFVEHNTRTLRIHVSLSLFEYCCLNSSWCEETTMADTFSVCACQARFSYPRRPMVLMRRAVDVCLSNFF